MHAARFATHIPFSQYGLALFQGQAPEACHQAVLLVLRKPLEATRNVRVRGRDFRLWAVRTYFF